MKISEEIQEQVREEFKLGTKLQDISDKFNLGLSTVKKYTKGLPKRTGSVTIEQKKAYAVKAVQKRRVKIKELSIEYKGGKCEKCGYNKCKDALDFHHLDPNEKDFGIGHKGYTRAWEKIKVELDKCILVCANCHREIHAELNKIKLGE